MMRLVRQSGLLSSLNAGLPSYAVAINTLEPSCPALIKLTLRVGSLSHLHYVHGVLNLYVLCSTMVRVLDSVSRGRGCTHICASGTNQYSVVPLLYSWRLSRYEIVLLGDRSTCV